MSTNYSNRSPSTFDATRSNFGLFALESRKSTVIQNPVEQQNDIKDLDELNLKFSQIDDAFLSLKESVNNVLTISSNQINFNTDLSESLENLLDNYRSSSNEYISLNTKVNSTITDIADNEEKINNNNVRINALTGNYNTINTSVSNILSNLDIINSDIAKFKISEASIKNTLASLNLINNDIVAINQAISDANESIDLIKTDIVNLKLKDKEFSDENIIIKSDISKLKTDVVINATAISNLNVETTTIKSDVDKLKTDVVTNTTSINDINTFKTSINTDIVGIKTEATNLKTKFETLEILLNSTVTDVADHATEINTIISDIENLKDAVVGEIDFSPVTTITDEIKSDITNIVNKYNTLKTISDTNQPIIDQALIDIAISNNKITDIYSNLGLINNKIDALSTDPTTLRIDKLMEATNIVEMIYDTETNKVLQSILFENDYKQTFEYSNNKLMSVYYKLGDTTLGRLDLTYDDGLISGNTTNLKRTTYYDITTQAEV